MPRGEGDQGFEERAEGEHRRSGAGFSRRCDRRWQAALHQDVEGARHLGGRTRRPVCHRGGIALGPVDEEFIFLDWLSARGRWLSHSVGMVITDRIHEAILKIPPSARPTSAVESDGEILDGAWAAERTGDVLKGWPRECG